MKKRLLFAFMFLFLIFIGIVFAHEDEIVEDEIVEDEAVEIEKINEVDYLPIPYWIILIVISAIPILILFYTDRKKSKKHIMFWLIIFLVSSITLIIVADTIYVTLKSETKGPVHWHADLQIWNCDNKLDIINPEGMANRVGTKLFHEHNDGRMHVEGVIRNIKDIDLHNFFNFVGGNLVETSFSILTNQGIIEAKDGELCNGEIGEVQIFLYKVINSHPRQKNRFVVEQLKVNENYVLSPYQDVPPGDCIIVEFDKRKEKTDKICDTYQLAIEQKKMEIV
ncbi:hypothetical protein HYT56_00075 [Candidatus Woesearchaeota archaeon]|nr:hypothetical protein [Candidatus Woesearchaeota archaeon]